MSEVAELPPEEKPVPVLWREYKHHSTLSVCDSKLLNKTPEEKTDTAQVARDERCDKKRKLAPDMEMYFAELVDHIDLTRRLKRHDTFGTQLVARDKTYSQSEIAVLCPMRHQGASEIPQRKWVSIDTPEWWFELLPDCTVPNKEKAWKEVLLSVHSFPAIVVPNASLYTDIEDMMQIGDTLSNKVDELVAHVIQTLSDPSAAVREASLGHLPRAIAHFFVVTGMKCLYDPYQDVVMYCFKIGLSANPDAHDWSGYWAELQDEQNKQAHVRVDGNGNVSGSSGADTAPRTDSEDGQRSQHEDDTIYLEFEDDGTSKSETVRVSIDDTKAFPAPSPTPARKPSQDQPESTFFYTTMQSVSSRLSSLVDAADKFYEDSK